MGARCHGHEYQHAANKEVAGICRRICAILELKKEEEEITRVCARNNTLGIIKVRARGQPREQKYVAALESIRKLAVTPATTTLLFPTTFSLPPRGLLSSGFLSYYPLNQLYNRSGLEFLFTP